MKQQTLDLTIAIVSWNTRGLLDRCLTSVSQTAHGIDVEVVVVDNASGDCSAEMVREEHPGVRLIKNSSNVGFAAANNQAYEASRGRYLLLLNSDTIVTDGALSTMVRWMDEHPECGACGPMLLNEDETLQPSWSTLPTVWDDVLCRLDRRVNGVDYSLMPVSELSRISPLCVGWVGGACLMVRHDTIERVGVMDQGYFMYCEETDWCWRISSAGYEVHYVPSARVIHLGGQSTKQARLRNQARLHCSRFRLSRKRYGVLRAAPVAISSGLRIATSCAVHIGRIVRRRERGDDGCALG